MDDLTADEPTFLIDEQSSQSLDLILRHRQPEILGYQSRRVQDRLSEPDRFRRIKAECVRCPQSANQGISLAQCAGQFRWLGTKNKGRCATDLNQAIDDLRSVYGVKGGYEVFQSLSEPNRAFLCRCL